MGLERRGRVIAVGVESTGTGKSSTLNGRWQRSGGGTSRMMREYQVRNLGENSPGLLAETVLSICSKLPAKLALDLAREPLSLHRRLRLQLAETPQLCVANHIIDGVNIHF